MAPIQLSPIWTPLICVWVWFPRKCVPMTDDGRQAPPPHCLYTINLFSNCDSGTVNSLLSSVCEAHPSLRPGRVWLNNRQTCSHYPSADDSLNVNVFLGRLHQWKISVWLITSIITPLPLQHPICHLRDNVTVNCQRRLFIRSRAS